MGNSKFQGRLIWLSSINFKYVHLQLHLCTIATNTHDQWSPDVMSNHGNWGRKSQVISTWVGGSIQACVEYDHIFHCKCKTAAAAKEREASWKKQTKNKTPPHPCLSLNALLQVQILGMKSDCHIVVIQKEKIWKRLKIKYKRHSEH